MFGGFKDKRLSLHRQNSNAAKMWTPQASYFYARRTIKEITDCAESGQRITPRRF